MRSIHQAILFACALACVTPAQAANESVASFYAGRTVTIYPGFAPGGSAALYSEALSRHMSRFIPGNPMMNVQHMPGAGGLTVMNYIANTAARDGTAFSITDRTAAFGPLMGNDNSKFDGRKLTWIGSANIESTTCVIWHTSPVKTIEDAKKHDIVIGASGATASEVVYAKAVNELIGTRFKFVIGYRGSHDTDLAMERGEVQANCGLGWTVVKNRHPSWLAKNEVRLLYQIALSKHPELPDVPLIIDYAKTPEDRRIFEFLFSPQEMGRPFFAPPGVPEERAAALRDAFMATLKDPQFLADATRLGLEVQPLDGAAVQKIVDRMYSTPAATLDRIKKIMNSGT